NWTDAESQAVALGGHLATINDTAENEWVRSNVLLCSGDRRGWIGFTDQDSEGDFVWISGQNPGYTNWNSGEPNNAGGVENYTEMFGSNGLWNDVPLAGAAAGDFGIVEVESAVTVGDLNCDNVVNTQDIPAFALALVDPSGYGAQYPGCNILR